MEGHDDRSPDQQEAFERPIALQSSISPEQVPVAWTTCQECRRVPLATRVLCNETTYTSKPGLPEVTERRLNGDSPAAATL